MLRRLLVISILFFVVQASSVFAEENLNCSENEMRKIISPIYVVFPDQNPVTPPRRHRYCLAKAIDFYIYNAHDKNLVRPTPEEIQWAENELQNGRVDFDHPLMNQWRYFEAIDRIRGSARTVATAIEMQYPESTERLYWGELIYELLQYSSLHSIWHKLIEDRGFSLADFKDNDPFLDQLYEPCCIDNLSRTIAGQIFATNKFF